MIGKRGVPSRFCIFFAEFCGAFPDIFSELFVEVVYIAVAYSFGNFVHLIIVLKQQCLGMFNSNVVHVGIKAFTNGFIKNLPKVGAVVSKQRCNRFELNVALVIVVDVVQDIIQNAVAGRTAGCAHYHFKLLG